eukprot:14839669-Ditylum_brightwellii.AAC.2
MEGGLIIGPHTSSGMPDKSSGKYGHSRNNNGTTETLVSARHHMLMPQRKLYYQESLDYSQNKIYSKFKTNSHSPENYKTGELALLHK